MLLKYLPPVEDSRERDEENAHGDDLSNGDGSHYGASDCLEDDDLSMPVVSTPFVPPDRRARNRLQDLSKGQDVHKFSMNSTLEPRARKDLNNVRPPVETDDRERDEENVHGDDLSMDDGSSHNGSYTLKTMIYLCQS